MKPFISLGIYEPKRPWRAWRIGKDITTIVKEFGLVPITDKKHRHQRRAAWNSKSLCAYVRRRTVQNPKALGWHQDGDLVTGSEMDNCMVLWSSNNPTQFKVGTEVYTPKHREIILVRNLVGLHRRPPDCPRIRYLFRQRVEIPQHVELP